MMQFTLPLLALAAMLLPAPSTPQAAGQADPALEARVKALAEEALAAQARGDQPTMLARFDAIVTLTRNPEAMHKLGHFYEAAKDVPNAPARAQHWFIEAATLGLGEAQKDLAKALEAEASLSDKEYATLIEALAKGAGKAYNAEGKAMLAKLATKYGAVTRCAIDAAKRLGYVADDSQALMSRDNPVHWYRVRSGTGSTAKGDRLNIYGTGEADSITPAAPYARLKLSGDGFTGIKVNRYGGGQGSYLEVKDYTGHVENPSSEGQRDIDMIAKTCRG